MRIIQYRSDPSTTWSVTSKGEVFYSYYTTMYENRVRLEIIGHDDSSLLQKGTIFECIWQHTSLLMTFFVNCYWVLMFSKVG